MLEGVDGGQQPVRAAVVAGQGAGVELAEDAADEGAVQRVRRDGQRLGRGVPVEDAVWADQSSGRYWGWDPKEVWAFISFLIYAVAAHDGSLRPLRRPVVYHAYMILAFLSVVMTYWGVNYFLGGLHSYA